MLATDDVFASLIGGWVNFAGRKGSEGAARQSKPRRLSPIFRSKTTSEFSRSAERHLPSSYGLHVHGHPAYLPPVVVVVMGVSGSGKSTVGKLLADRLGWEFRDGDDFHPAANVAKMKAGVALDDGDRAPWLDAIARHAREIHAVGGHLVVACSALKAAYRDRLGRPEPWLRFVHLRGSPELIAARLAARKGHFMPPGLLASQFSALEADPEALDVDIEGPPAVLVDRIISELGLSDSGKSHAM